MFGLLLLVVFAVFCGVLAKDSFDYDFFFPNTYFKINLDGCSSESDCNVYLYLLGNPYKPTNETHTMVRDVFDFPSFGDRAGMKPEVKFPLKFVDKGVYYLEEAIGLPDALTPGVYPNSTFIVEKGNETRMLTNFTFYKSQGYMEFDSHNKDGLITLNIPETGIYAPSFNITNYMPNTKVNTYFKMADDNEKKYTYLKTKIDGVKKCDHFAIYGGDEDSQILAVPTIFNIPFDNNGEEEYFPTYAVSRVNNFKILFASDNNFSYSAYPPVLSYNSTKPKRREDGKYIFLDFNFNVTGVDKDPKIDSKTNREHYKRGDKIHVESEVRINESFLQFLHDYADNVDTADHLYFTMAICHTNRTDDVWSYIHTADCENSTYAAAPPYKCELTAEVDDKNPDKGLKVKQSQSTRNLYGDYINIDILNGGCENKDEDENCLYSFSTDYVTSGSNPIPFRVVPLVGIQEENSNGDGVIYRFIPFGPASKIYVIDLDVLPALYFFLIVFLSITALCVIAYFVGGVIVKKVKAGKGVEAKRLTEVSEDSNRSILDSDQTSDKDGSGAAESDKLMNNKNSSSSHSSSEEGKNIA